MKTLAIRLDDEVAEFLGIVAQLEGTSVIDQIRSAIMSHLTHKMADGDLAEQAKTALADIDREASARKQAILTVLGPKASEADGSSKSGTRRRQTPKPEEARVIQIGFAPPGRKGGRRDGQ